MKHFNTKGGKAIRNNLRQKPDMDKNLFGRKSLQRKKQSKDKSLSEPKNKGEAEKSFNKAYQN